ncbi:hypothetical protein PanWU01x14_336590 [Parasponia andersonii]|uniref:Uncharacterized protein n=1 Tax=Parasponia andersonii TaxID=3476 RepID=A0A2P5AFW4_PARAD|nr:hypothetical protein PanWU01x14_336590 [Parasponia andersonii]
MRLLKLKLFRTSLRTWNREVSGDLSSKVNRATNRVTEILNKLQANSFSEEIFREEADTLAALDNVLTLKDSFMRNKCRIKWLKEEDLNTSFYHATLKRRKANKTLSSLVINDEIVTDPIRIAAHAINYCASLFSELLHYSSNLSIIREHVPCLVTSLENIIFLHLLLEQEIRNTIFDMDLSSMPGSDGCTRKFFRSYWSIVGDDFVSAVQEFFCTGKMFLDVNSNFIVLIPKVNEANKME